MFLVLSNSDDYVNRQPKMFSIKGKQLGTLFFSYHIKFFFFLAKIFFCFCILFSVSKKFVQSIETYQWETLSISIKSKY